MQEGKLHPPNLCAGDNTVAFALVPARLLVLVRAHPLLSRNTYPFTAYPCVESLGVSLSVTYFVMYISVTSNYYFNVMCQCSTVDRLAVTSQVSHAI